MRSVVVVERTLFCSVWSTLVSLERSVFTSMEKEGSRFQNQNQNQDQSQNQNQRLKFLSTPSIRGRSPPPLCIIMQHNMIVI